MEGITYVRRNLQFCWTFFYTKLKTPARVFFGGPGGIRTHDQLIKSQLLYRLSYRSKNIISKLYKEKYSKSSFINQPPKSDGGAQN